MHIKETRRRCSSSPWAHLTAPRHRHQHLWHSWQMSVKPNLTMLKGFHNSPKQSIPATNYPEHLQSFSFSLTPNLFCFNLSSSVLVLSQEDVKKQIIIFSAFFNSRLQNKVCFHSWHFLLFSSLFASGPSPSAVYLLCSVASRAGQADTEPSRVRGFSPAFNTQHFWNLCLYRWHSSGLFPHSFHFDTERSGLDWMCSWIRASLNIPALTADPSNSWTTLSMFEVLGSKKFPGMLESSEIDALNTHASVYSL